MQPEVSLSSRWTMPGRSAPPQGASFPLQWWRRAFTRVPVRFPLAGWTTMPDALLRTMTWSSSWMISRGRSSGCDSSDSGAGMWMVMMSPWLTEDLGFDFSSFTRMSPDLRSAWMRARESSGRFEVRKTSRRIPEFSSTLICIIGGCM